MATKTLTEILVNKISVGGKAPKSIYKGSTEVKKVYKGSTLIYEKGSVTYTLTVSGNTIDANGTSISFTVQSYKGTGKTPVTITSSNISGTSNKMTNMAISHQGSGTYKITFTVPKNTTTGSPAFPITVTQPVSGLTASGNCYQSQHTLTISRIGFRFSGSFPTSSGIECRCTNLNLGGTYKYENWNGSQASTGNYGPMEGNCRTISTTTSYPTSAVYWNISDLGSPKVTNGTGWQFSFLFGASWSGTTAYSGNTWYMHVREDKNKTSNIYIPQTTSSMSWQTYKQPSGPIGWSGVFGNITTTSTAYDLIVDVNWSWGSYWS